MPFNWGPETERQMLLLIIDHMETRPSTEVYQKVADALGGGLNANAVRYDEEGPISSGFVSSLDIRSLEPFISSSLRFACFDIQSSRGLISPFT